MAVAIVTGSESGIGRATAIALAKRGMDIGVTWYRSEEDGQAAVAEVLSHGVQAELRHVDLLRLPDAAGVVDDLAEALGGVDVLVNDAGTGTMTPFLDLTYDDLRRVLAVDL